jgi:drug/metabolite transporter (DMT)-like permease
VAASISAFYPVLAALIATRLHGERLTWRALTGALIAAAGVVVLFLR